MLRATIDQIDNSRWTAVNRYDLARKCGDTITSDTIKAEVSDSVLMVNYIYLDTNERRAFAQTDHEYLIEQVRLRV